MKIEIQASQDAILARDWKVRNRTNWKGVAEELKKYFAHHVQTSQKKLRRGGGNVSKNQRT